MVRIVHGTKSPQMVRNVYGTKSLAFRNTIGSLQAAFVSLFYRIKWWWWWWAQNQSTFGKLWQYQYSNPGTEMLL